MPDTKRRQRKTSERLAQMLVIVPYLVRHPGTHIEEAASLFGLDQSDLRKDLDLLFMSGLPPYGPGDLIDVEVDEDQIWIRMADQFSRPVRLTRNEALALYLRGTELLATPGLAEAGDLASALEKLRAALGEDSLEGVDPAIAAADTREKAPFLDDLRLAAAEHRRCRITYVAASTGEVSDREIEPEEVFASLGNWYVAAWDVSADAERMFRVDRVRSLADAGRTFEPRGLAGAGRDLYTPTEEDVPVRLSLKPGSRWIAEYYAVTDASEKADGTLDVTLPARRLGWVAGLLMRVGPQASVVAPEELLERLRDQIERTKDQYQRGSPDGSRPA
jgi:predicted DNA-binding transcriptional regulator YafY